jgi:hypothetical protein
VEEHLDVCDVNGYETTGFPSEAWDIERLYENSADEWDVSDIRSGLKSHKPAFYIHDGHGNPSYVWCEQTRNVNSTNYPQNGGDKGNFFIAMTGACLPGAFDENADCIMEAFAKLNTGIVASISNDKSGWGDNDGTDGCTHRPYMYLTDALFNDTLKMHHMGRIHARGREANGHIALNSTLNTEPYFYCIVYCMYETVLLGDPALSVWTDTPKDMQASYPTPLNSTTFAWETGGAYTWVALVDDQGKIIATQLTGKDGKCSITTQALTDYVTANPNGNLKVRAKAHNYLKFEGDLPIATTAILDKNNIYKFTSSFNSSSKLTNISYTLPKNGVVSLALYNSKGSVIRNIVNKYQSAGQYKETINNADLSNGIYYCRLNADGKTMISKFVVAK